jgi:hypothetical protein
MARLSTPRVGVGKCKDGAIVALTADRSGAGDRGPHPASAIDHLSDAGAAQSHAADDQQSISARRIAPRSGLTAPTCTGSPGNMTIDAQGNTMLFGNVNVNAGDIIHLKAGVYNLNSVTLGGNAQIVVDTGPVVINVAGVGHERANQHAGRHHREPDVQSGELEDPVRRYVPVTVAGGAASAAILYAPNARLRCRRLGFLRIDRRFDGL